MTKQSMTQREVDTWIAITHQLDVEFYYGVGPQMINSDNGAHFALILSKLKLWQVSTPIKNGGRLF